MTRSFERFRELYPDGYDTHDEDGYYCDMRDFEEYLSKQHEEIPDNELVIEIPEDFELKGKDQLNERSSR